MSKTSSASHDSSFWIGTSPEASPAASADWRARRKLASLLRRINRAALTSDVPAELLESVAETLEAQLASLEPCERIFGRRAHAERLAGAPGMVRSIGYEMGPVLGHGNAVAPPMHMWRHEDSIHGSVTPDWTYEGPDENLHGGVIALLFDQLLGTGLHITGGSARTGTLTVRYHHPTPLNRPLRLRACVDRVEGRKVYMAGELWLEELRTASCEGVFIRAKDRP